MIFSFPCGIGVSVVKAAKKQGSAVMNLLSSGWENSVQGPV